jgi:hypothetical protein
MSALSASWRSIVAIALATLLGLRAPVRAGDADAKLITQLVREIEQLSSLYAKSEKPVAIDTLPKFAAKAVDELKVNDVPPLQTARGRWKANPEQYAKAVPLRGAYFAAADNIEQARRLAVPALFIARNAVSPKDKAIFLKKQEPIGVSLFKLEQALAQVKESEDKREQDKSALWQARFDWARAVLEADMIFLFEYNYALAQVRADNLPQLGPKDDGWKIAFQPKIGVTEAKAKELAKHVKKLWTQIQEKYPDTPFAYFAERESRRDLGMTWTAKKK